MASDAGSRIGDGRNDEIEKQVFWKPCGAGNNILVETVFRQNFGVATVIPLMEVSPGEEFGPAPAET